MKALLQELDHPQHPMFWSLPMLSLPLLFLILQTAGARPNFVVVITDDQDIFLDGLSPMNKTRKFFAEEGTVFDSAYVTTPICCPSRSSILTGLYVRNHGTIDNSISGGCCGPDWKNNFEPYTFPALLHREGYRTFYAGKYLNQYGHRKSGGVIYVPPGWDWWIGLVGNSAYYNYTLSVNGSSVVHGDAPEDYLTDVLAGFSKEFLRDNRGPFLMVVATPAPHEPFSPAKRHAGAFKGRMAPRTAAFDSSPGKRKHWLLRLPPKRLPENVIEDIDRVFRDRWETLLAVDELFDGIVTALAEDNLLQDTYVIFMSDNGFHLGQFGLPWDKRQPYETDIRIPFMMAGPQVPKKRVLKYPVLNIDLAPTILEAAGVESDNPMDGESILQILNEVDVPGRNFIVEYHGEGSDGDNCYGDASVKLCRAMSGGCKCFDSRNNTYMCIRRLGEFTNEMYCRFRDLEMYREMYDLDWDPDQMENLVSRRAGKVAEYDAILDCCSQLRAGDGVGSCIPKQTMKKGSQ